VFKQYRFSPSEQFMFLDKGIVVALWLSSKRSCLSQDKSWIRNSVRHPGRDSSLRNKRGQKRRASLYTIKVLIHTNTKQKTEVYNKRRYICGNNHQAGIGLRLFRTSRRLVMCRQFWGELGTSAIT
jgi:hypothetical protein